MKKNRRWAEVVATECEWALTPRPLCCCHRERPIAPVSAGRIRRRSAHPPGRHDTTQGLPQGCLPVLGAALPARIPRRRAHEEEASWRSERPDAMSPSPAQESAARTSMSATSSVDQLLEWIGLETQAKCESVGIGLGRRQVR